MFCCAVNLVEMVEVLVTGRVGVSKYPFKDLKHLVWLWDFSPVRVGLKT